MMFKRYRHIHFVGIGGVGMSGIAEVLLNLGYRVSGSDLRESETTRRLARLGAEIFVGHRPEHVQGAQVVVISSAVTPENVEVRAARQLHVPVIPRAEMLAELMRLKYGVAVAGAHGKTTTTSLVAAVLAHGGLDPTVVIGGKVNSLGTGARMGQGDFMVVEADESDGSFLKLSPTLAVTTNLDREHLDHYGTVEALEEAFVQFLNKVPFYGLAVLCLDDPRLQNLLPRIEKRRLTYGLTAMADLEARDLVCGPRGSRFQAFFRGEPLGLFRLSMPGRHNVLNALAAVAVGLELEVPVPRIQEALANFSGVARRFQVKGTARSITVVDDYGHHPTEIRATLAAARLGQPRRVVVCFQPHRYTRTRDLLADFCTAFYEADHLVLMDIYPAGEKPLPGIHTGLLYDGIREHGHRDVHYCPDREAAVSHLLRFLREGDLLLTLGAGDVWKVGEAVLARLGETPVARGP